jgi:hypothetical protein
MMAAAPHQERFGRITDQEKADATLAKFARHIELEAFHGDFAAFKLRNQTFSVQIFARQAISRMGFICAGRIIAEQDEADSCESKRNRPEPPTFRGTPATETHETIYEKHCIAHLQRR